MQKGWNTGNKERKLFLELRRLIKCGRCAYHNGDNWKKRSKPNKYKNIDRKTIRKENENGDE